MEVELEASDARAGKTYGARLRFGHEVSPLVEFDYREVADNRGSLAWCSALAWLAVRLGRRRGRDDVPAMPFGIDTPTLFAMVFGVLGPVMVATGDPVLAWKVGMVATLAIGLAKVGLAFVGDWARRVVPRAALLGSIAGVAVLLIAFLPMLKILPHPPLGLLAPRGLLLRPFRRVRMPFGFPGAFA